MTHVCLGSIVSGGFMSGRLEFKTELGGQLFSTCQIISVCMCFVDIIFIVGGRSAS